MLCLFCSYGAKSNKQDNERKTIERIEECDYYNQAPPGGTPEMFAPEVFSLEKAVHGVIAFHPNCREIYWILFSPTYGDHQPSIQYVTKTKGQWSEPMIFEHTREYGAMNMSISPDGERLFFASRRPWPDSWGKQPGPKSLESYKIWVCEREDSTWKQPRILDRRINQDLGGITSTLDGTLYTHGIKRIRCRNGRYSEWQKLSSPLNTGRIRGGNPFIAADESYILFNGKWPGVFGYGIFISFRLQDNIWTEPVNILQEAKAERGGSQPVVTPDGKYLFFYAAGHFYWMDAAIIETLRNAQ
jgi:hypothetical protein